MSLYIVGCLVPFGNNNTALRASLDEIERTTGIFVRYDVEPDDLEIFSSLIQLGKLSIDFMLSDGRVFVDATLSTGEWT